MPSLGVKVDSLPGRLNQTAFIAKRPGLFMGAINFIVTIANMRTPGMDWFNLNLFV